MNWMIPMEFEHTRRFFNVVNQGYMAEVQRLLATARVTGRQKRQGQAGGCFRYEASAHSPLRLCKTKSMSWLRLAVACAPRSTKEAAEAGNQQHSRRRLRYRDLIGYGRLSIEEEIARPDEIHRIGRTHAEP